MTDHRTFSRRSIVAGAGGMALATLAGCSAAGSQSKKTTTATSSPNNGLNISPGKASIGDTITVRGSSLPANTKLQLEWQRVTGHWILEQHSKVRGAEYTTTMEPVKTVTTDANGAVSTTLKIPEDHGGKHAVALVKGGNQVATGSVHVTPTFTIDRTTVPLGELLTVDVKGMPYSKYRRDDQILWDNKFTGLVTGVTNKGTVRAKVPAAGPPGKHVLEVGGGYEGATYLNPQQSPYPRNPRYAHWEVTVTESKRSSGDTWLHPNREQKPIQAFYPSLDSAQGSISVTPTSGIVGSTATFQGSGLPANESITLDWLTMTGSRVSGNGYSSKHTTLTTVRTDAKGAFSKEFSVPDDLGGTHPIVASVGGKSTAVTGFVIMPSIVDFHPKSGPVGTPIHVHLKGVGWTEYNNTYAVTYDDAFEGYGCGFNTQGDVQMQFRASGRPGMHTINAFPVIYKKPSEKRTVGFYTKPQLTYLDDHPAMTLPAMGFLFEVTK